VSEAPKILKEKLGEEHVSDQPIRPVACEKQPFFISKEHRYHHKKEEEVTGPRHLTRFFNSGKSLRSDFI
jgi:hypothetical protein